MDGQGKLEYTKDALNTILNDMREGDRFTIITFHSDVASWRESLSDVTTENIQAAKTFVDGLAPLYCKSSNRGLP